VSESRQGNFLLDARQVLARGPGIYWQFTPGSRAKSPLSDIAVYLGTTAAPSIEQVLRQELSWFIPEGVTALGGSHATQFRERVGEASRMPDEPEGGAALHELSAWLDEHDGQTLFIQLQRFA
jgi:hypothetical protein